MARITKQKIQAGDVLLAVKGSVGKVGVVSDDIENNVYAGQSFVVLRLKHSSPIENPIVLYRYLKSELAQNLLLSKASGAAAVKMIKMQDVADLPVVVTTKEEQDNIITNQQEIEELYDTIETMKSNVTILEDKFWSLNT